MIINEKIWDYTPPSARLNVVQGPDTFAKLPHHLLLQIIQSLVVSQGNDALSHQRTRRTLYWLGKSARLVNRAFYTVCMHILRSTYLPVYAKLVRAPFTSDPFPTLNPSSTSTAAPPSYTTAVSGPSTSEPPSSINNTSTRETNVLDLFIALKLRDDVFTDDSELHLSSLEETMADVFGMMQPKARCEDLICKSGIQAGVISLTSEEDDRRLPFSQLSVAFSSREVGLVLNRGGGRKSKILAVKRNKSDPLEYAVQDIIYALRR